MSAPDVKTCKVCGGPLPAGIALVGVCVSCVQDAQIRDYEGTPDAWAMPGYGWQVEDDMEYL